MSTQVKEKDHTNVSRVLLTFASAAGVEVVQQ
jgi:hypothetical protein